MPQHLSLEKLKEVTQVESLDKVTISEIFELFHEEKGIQKYAPDSVCQIDPRDGGLIIYNSARGRRPHDNVSEKEFSQPDQTSCPICKGKTTGIMDIAALSKGYTLINKNLYPILYPKVELSPEFLEASDYHDPHHSGKVSFGLHFLQWTSSYHDNDWQNMPLKDLTIVVDRMAALEKKLLYESEGIMPASKPIDVHKPTHGFVSIIKNYGALVGGSLVHGHQQIAWSNLMPRRFYNNLRFFHRRWETFSSFIIRENPDDLLIRDYGDVVLIVPYFMRRPYNMLLIVKNYHKQYLFELNESERVGVAQGWQDAIRAILSIMPKIGKEPAYNVTVNNGPGAGLYFEFLPYTQETGGFEHLGLWVCQDNPVHVAKNLRKSIKDHPITA